LYASVGTMTKTNGTDAAKQELIEGMKMDASVVCMADHFSWVAVRFMPDGTRSVGETLYGQNADNLKRHVREMWFPACMCTKKKLYVVICHNASPVFYCLPPTTNRIKWEWA